MEKNCKNILPFPEFKLDAFPSFNFVMELVPIKVTNTNDLFGIVKFFSSLKLVSLLLYNTCNNIVFQIEDEFILL